MDHFDNYNIKIRPAYDFSHQKKCIEDSKQRIRVSEQILRDYEKNISEQQIKIDFCNKKIISIKNQHFLHNPILNIQIKQLTEEINEYKRSIRTSKEFLKIHNDIIKRENDDVNYLEDLIQRSSYPSKVHRRPLLLAHEKLHKYRIGESL